MNGVIDLTLLTLFPLLTYGKVVMSITRRLGHQISLYYPYLGKIKLLFYIKKKKIKTESHHKVYIHHKSMRVDDDFKGGWSRKKLTCVEVVAYKIL